MPFWACSRFSAWSNTTERRPVDHLGAHLLAAMRRQAMHEQRLRLGAGHQARHRPGTASSRRRRRSASLVAHRDPHVGHDRIGARDRLVRVLDHLDAAPGARRPRPAPRAPGRARADRPAAAGNRSAAAAWIHEVATLLPSPTQRGCGPRIGPRCSSKVITSAMIWQGCEQVGQAVDHRHGGCLGQLQELGVAVGADHDRIDVAREHARGIGDRLAAAELHVPGVQHHGVAAQRLDRHLERDPGPGRRLVEDHRQRLAGEALRSPSPFGLELAGPVEDAAQSTGASSSSRSRKWRG